MWEQGLDFGEEVRLSLSDEAHVEVEVEVLWGGTPCEGWACMSGLTETRNVLGRWVGSLGPFCCPGTFF